MATHLDGDWHRLAEALIARRAELGWPKRLPFARAHGLTHDRALSDLENERRTRFDPATIAQVEHIYRWAPGSVRNVLAGGDATPLDETVGAADQDAGVLLSLPDGALDGLNPTEREEAVSAAKATLLERIREIRRRVDQ